MKIAFLPVLCAISLSISGCMNTEKIKTNEEMSNDPMLMPEAQIELKVEVPDPDPAPKPEPVIYYTDNDAVMLARLVYGEARGISSVTEQACVMWTVLNRVDANFGCNGGIAGQITAPNQFYYIKGNPTVDDYGRDLYALAKDVLGRWNDERNGETNVGRVLPSEYMWFSGNGKHNIFRNKDKGGSAWDYSLPSPYES